MESRAKNSDRSQVPMWFHLGGGFKSYTDTSQLFAEQRVCGNDLWDLAASCRPPVQHVAAASSTPSLCHCSTLWSLHRSFLQEWDKTKRKRFSFSETYLKLHFAVWVFQNKKRKFPRLRALEALHRERERKHHIFKRNIKFTQKPFGQHTRFHFLCVAAWRKPATEKTT